ncbi:MAG TPA: YggS family pyridoxal phosphate-dependent enzyme [Bacteroidota bacterium]|nr:YggS family pyridoxal phosphate-dependent enzyme [Bacteroidota bacterium]
MIYQNVEHIRERTRIACLKAGRDPAAVTLLAVSKTFPATAVKEAVDAGVLDIGENYVQEMLKKREDLQDSSIRWHFIGHLQSNKVKYLSDWVFLIHAVDNATLAGEINKRGVQFGRFVDILVEVNTTDESSKFGVHPQETVEFIQSLSSLDHIKIKGLMTIGPFLPDPEGSRPMFRQLRMLKEEISLLNLPNVEMEHLSMGMTGDFEVAIDEGATIIRIGTAIFGSRTKKT